jgi:hypothetical protein
VIEIIRPYDGSEVSTTTVTLKYAIRSSSGDPITGIRALVNGRPIVGKRSAEVLEVSPNGEITLSIPARDCDVSLIAENRFGFSEPSTIRLKWKGKAEEEFVIKPKLYVLAVGIGAYEDKSLKLELPAKDAKDFAAALEKQTGLVYRDVVVKVLADTQATKGDILDGLEWIQRETTSNDVAAIFLAGHGVNDPNGFFYFLPVDVDLARLKRTGVSFSEIKNTISSIAGKVLVFVDACHSGNIMGARRGTPDISAVVNELTSVENGSSVVFTSSTGKQYSLEDRAWGNGAFTKALVEGLLGKAEYKHDGRISVKMLDLYVSERVKELTRGQQMPTTVIPPDVPDFTIAVTK